MTVLITLPEKGRKCASNVTAFWKVELKFPHVFYKDLWEGGQIVPLNAKGLGFNSVENGSL